MLLFFVIGEDFAARKNKPEKVLYLLLRGQECMLGSGIQARLLRTPTTETATQCLRQI